MALTTLTVFFSWFTVAFIDFALLYNISGLSGNTAFNTIYATLGRFIVSSLLPVADHFIDRAGRKAIDMVGLLGIACGLVGIILAKANVFVNGALALMVVRACSLLCITFTGIVWDMCQFFSTECFPTILRNLVFGASISVSRIGGIIGPQVLTPNIWSHAAIPYGVCLFLVILSMVLMLVFIPETKHKTLPDLPDNSNTDVERVDVRDSSV